MTAAELAEFIDQFELEYKVKRNHLRALLRVLEAMEQPGDVPKVS